MPSLLRRFIVLTALALASLAGAAEPLRVMSFNVRNSNAKDGEDAWPKRTELFFGTIAAYAPDLIGFQEVLADQYDAIAARLPEFGFVGVARDDGKRKGEWSSIGYRKSRFTAVADGNFWLSETPEVIGSKSWDAALTRICSWVRLRETATGKEFVFANTHFDHVGKIARQEASKVISQRVSAIAAGVPALLTGDLNINEDNPAYAVFVKPTTPGAIRWTDAFRAVHPQRGPDEVSFHGFKGGTKGSRIDFIFHTDHFVATAATIDRTAKDGRYPSDHYPVTAVVKWK